MHGDNRAIAILLSCFLTGCGTDTAAVQVAEQSLPRAADRPAQVANSERGEFAIKRAARIDGMKDLQKLTFDTTEFACPENGPQGNYVRAFFDGELVSVELRTNNERPENASYAHYYLDDGQVYLSQLAADDEPKTQRQLTTYYQGNMLGQEGPKLRESLDPDRLLGAAAVRQPPCD